VGVRFGRYELLGILGRGGMAEVFLARYQGPEGFEKRLVIKRVLPKLGSDRRFLKLFFDEARTQVSLSHGNLVPVFDFGRVGNAYFIAMEHVPGCDLGALLSAARDHGATVPPRLVAHLGAELLRGLAYVHRRGFVHRDLAPRNVLLSRDGEVKLSDFGVALAASLETAGVRGTLAYMAPEQARGERVDGRADLYALGLVLAEALTGRRARPSASDEAALTSARSGGPATVEGPLASIILRATQADPAARFADADEMLLALEKEAATLERGSTAPARELAALVAGWMPESDAPHSAAAELPPGTAVTEGEETYFRDRESASFVEEVLPPARARPRWLLPAGAAALLVALSTGVMAWRAFTPPPPAPVVDGPTQAGRALGPAPAAPPASATPPPSTPPTEEKPPAAEATGKPPAPTPRAPAPVNVRHHVSPALAAGTVLIHCTPWCVPFVDGERRGQDGRNHTLSLSAGPHRVVAERLDDRQERAVRVEPGASSTVDFTFE
jgi:hypothetical protein